MLDSRSNNTVSVSVETSTVVTEEFFNNTDTCYECLKIIALATSLADRKSIADDEGNEK